MAKLYWLFIIPTLVIASESSSGCAGTGSIFPNHVVILSTRESWGFVSTNLFLTFTNGAFSTGNYSVNPSLISNVLAAALRPWPKPASNTWPRFTIDAPNLGLTRDWVKGNYGRLLDAYSNTEGVAFPRASEQQRAWLTNALADTDLLTTTLGRWFVDLRIDDRPTMELRFEHDDGRVVRRILQLKTTSYWPFMLPWEVHGGTNDFISGNADISRAVLQILPPGFLNRRRLDGDSRLDSDLFRVVSAGFPPAPKTE